MSLHTQLFIAGRWAAASQGTTITVSNPATGKPSGSVAHAGADDLDRAVAAAVDGFEVWRVTPAFDRSRILRKAGDLLRERCMSIARDMTIEQGKPLGEASLEVMNSADILDWFAEETRRIYGRSIPARSSAVSWQVEKEPVGPVAAFTPWNFPMNQAVRKAGAALAAGCSMVLKGSEETPSPVAALVQALADAGLPDGVLNLVFGTPSEISEMLIAHPAIRKISFTGSTSVGKHLAAMAGHHMKRVTMELGGSAPVLVFKDADIIRSSRILARSKLRNAGQVCIAPTRFIIEDEVHDAFVEEFISETRKVKVGDGLEDGVEMGPLANSRRVDAVEAMIVDAVHHGAQLRTGGKRIGNTGNFLEPAVLVDVPVQARAMHEEPFGPLAVFSRFSGFDVALTEANRLPYGLASYIYTGSAETANKAARAIESGMIAVNHQGLGPIETPFGGVKESGYGSEGGSEAIDPYLTTKFISTMVSW